MCIRDRGAGVTVTVEPRVRPEGVELHPMQRDAAAYGAEDALASGPATGAPLQDLAVRVLEVELFGALSSPQALRVAVAEATRKALVRAGSLVLRPVMDTEVVVPESDVGVVIGDLQSRRAVIRDTTTSVSYTHLLYSPLQSVDLEWREKIHCILPAKSQAHCKLIQRTLDLGGPLGTHIF